MLRKQGHLSNKLAKRLNNFETAYAVMRHITLQHVEDFLQDLHDELEPAVPSDNDSPRSFCFGSLSFLAEKEKQDCTGADLYFCGNCDHPQPGAHLLLPPPQ